MEQETNDGERWETIARPSYFGKKRDSIRAGYDAEYGKDNWRITWRWGERVLEFKDACRIYEDGYFHDSLMRESLWRHLSLVAKDVYDYEEADVESGLDYLIQKGPATHLQDIAIRNVMFRRGLDFKGQQLIQIRHHDNYWGSQLSPGKIPFYDLKMIVGPNIKGWWNPNSVEDMWQSNKVLQVKKEELENILKS